MEAAGLLSAENAARAREERLRIVPLARPFIAPHFLDRVRADVGADPARRIETTLDAALQREVAGILAMHRRRLDEHGARHVAVAVLDNPSGEWLAWEGSGRYADGDEAGRIDGVVAPRQPGSAVKPFTYALAFERGFTPATVLPDVPAHFPTAEPGVLYSPRNYDGLFRGPLRARPALGGSENVPAVWTLSRVGVPDLLRLLRRGGITTLDAAAAHYGPALTMGDAEMRLDELVAAYAALARGGVWRPATRVRAIARDGGVERPRAPAGERLISPRAAFWVTDILADPDARAWVFGAGSSLDFPFPVAVKTGTSQAYRDNWTIGFTRDGDGRRLGRQLRPRARCGIRPGSRERRRSSTTCCWPPSDVSRGRLPGPGDPPLAAPPEGLARRMICALSGREATGRCPRVESGMAARRRRRRRARGTATTASARWWTGRRPTGPGPRSGGWSRARPCTPRTGAAARPARPRRRRRRPRCAS